MTAPPTTAPRARRSPYPTWFFLPAAIVHGVLFLLPTVASPWFSLTRWTLAEAELISFGSFRQFFSEPFLVQGVASTLTYAVLTSGLKTVLGLLLTLPIIFRGLLRTLVFFPVLVSTIGVDFAFEAMMHPTKGAINVALDQIGIDGPGWLVDPRLALISVMLVDVWKGMGLATVIFMAGIVSILQDYHEAARIDGATRLQQFWRVTVPLVQPATIIVVTLSLISGLRCFDLIWAMTGGGPGFSSDVIASVIYKQYQAGFYGLATAGNVVLIALIVLPLTWWFNRREVEA